MGHECGLERLPGRGARTLGSPLQQSAGTGRVLGRSNLIKFVVQDSHLVGVQECKGVSLMWRKCMCGGGDFIFLFLID